jgi:hypothetical protein
MQRLEVSGAVRLIYRSLGVKGLNTAKDSVSLEINTKHNIVRAECTNFEY